MNEFENSLSHYLTLITNRSTGCLSNITANLGFTNLFLLPRLANLRIRGDIGQHTNLSQLL
jgi:hypothetical protein